MKKGLTELVFILDRSGSMSNLVSDTIGGFNSIFMQQTETGGECNVSTVLFDHQYEVLHYRIKIKEIKPITEKEYWVRGQTALLDAIGRTINQAGLELSNTTEEERPEKVMFVIITDGLENASKEYTKEKVKEMIEHQKEKYGWEFVFLGANIDAVDVASQIGIAKNKVANYVPDKAGALLKYNKVREMVSYMRESNVDKETFDRYVAEKLGEVEEDHKKRGKK